MLFRSNYMNQILVELVKLANLIVQVSKALACAGRVPVSYTHLGQAAAEQGVHPLAHGRNAVSPAGDRGQIGCLLYTSPALSAGASPLRAAGNSMPGSVSSTACTRPAQALSLIHI